MTATGRAVRLAGMSFAGDLRAVVRHRDFRRLFATRLTSQAADGAFQAALASLFFFSPERQTSAGSVAAAFATLLLPYSLVGPFAGVLLDRWRRRQILVVANLLRAAHGARRRPALTAADVDRRTPLRRRARLPVGQPVLPGRAVGRPAARGDPRRAGDGQLGVDHHRHRSSRSSAAASASGSSGCSATASDADAQVIVVAALGLRRRRPCSRPGWTATCSGRTSTAEPPQTREAVRRVARGLVDGARHVWHHRAGRARPGGDRRAPLLLRRLDHLGDPAVPVSYFNDPDDVDAGPGRTGGCVRRVRRRLLRWRRWSRRR